VTEDLNRYGTSQKMIEINLSVQRACPFCGCYDLRVVDWADDDGEYQAIECCQCKGCAPAEAWNKRFISL